MHTLLRCISLPPRVLTAGEALKSIACTSAPCFSSHRFMADTCTARVGCGGSRGTLGTLGTSQCAVTPPLWPPASWKAAAPAAATSRPGPSRPSSRVRNMATAARCRTSTLCCCRLAPGRATSQALPTCSCPRQERFADAVLVTTPWPLPAPTSHPRYKGGSSRSAEQQTDGKGKRSWVQKTSGGPAGLADHRGTSHPIAAPD